jgi:beta-lactamase regulating signal transducer with metallopeptidase domain
MFALRGIAVSLALFWLSYCVLSVLVACGWRSLERLKNLSAKTSASLYFAIRVFPLLASASGALAFAAPSFILLEPRGTSEEVGLVPLILSACCLAFVAAGVVRLIRAQANTSRIVTGWLQGAKALEIGACAPTFQAGSDIPPLALAGVCRPRLLLSQSAVAVLSPDELRSAVRHEIAHLRFRDNLKKLVLRFAWFPGMARLEHAWQHAAELAADDAAVSNAREALDLAAALIKVSRLVPSRPLPAISMGLVQDGAVSARVSRLLNWRERPSRSRSSRWLAISSVLASLLVVASAYGPLIAQTHRVTEWLVR